MPKKRVVILFNQFTGDGLNQADFDTDDTIAWLLSVIGRKYECESLNANTDPSVWVPQLRDMRPDLVFNVAEGSRSEVREAFFPALLEQMNLRYTGPGPLELAICQSKHLTKVLLSSAGVRVPKGFPVYLATSPIMFPYSLTWPLIVKLNAEGSSLGLDAKSIVSNEVELQSKISELYKNFRCPIVVEEFIPGHDFSVTYLEPYGVCGPVEYSFPDQSPTNVHDYQLKVFDHEQVNVKISNMIPPSQKEEMLDLARRAAYVIGIREYCRVDIRLSTEGIPYVLEVNGQVCFNIENSFLVATKTLGKSAEDVVGAIVERGLTRIIGSSQPCRDYIL